MPRRLRPRGRDFDDEAVAVQVQDVRVAGRGVHGGVNHARRFERVECAAAGRRRDAGGLRGSRHTRPNGRSCAARPCAGSCATNVTSSPRACAHAAELRRQQRVGRLIRRQVRRDVTDAHAGSQADARSAVRAPGRTAPGTPRTSPARRPGPSSRTSGRGSADRRTRRARPASGCTGCRRRWPRSSGRADSGSARRASTIWRASAIMSSAELYDGRSQRTWAMPEQAQHPLGRVRPRRASVPALDERRHAPVERRRNRQFEQLARARRRRVVVGQEIRRERRVDEVRPAPCAPRRTAARRSTRPGSPAARATTRARPRIRSARAIRHRPHADGLRDGASSATPAARRTAPAAATARRDAARRPPG